MSQGRMGAMKRLGRSGCGKLSGATVSLHLLCSHESFSFVCLFSLRFMAVLHLRCCMRASSSCSEWGLLSSCNAQAPHCTRSSYCGAWALDTQASAVVTHGLDLFCGMCDLPGPGTEPVSPALPGGFFTTEPPGKSLVRVI